MVAFAAPNNRNIRPLVEGAAFLFFHKLSSIISGFNRILTVVIFFLCALGQRPQNKFWNMSTKSGTMCLFYCNFSNTGGCNCS